MSYIPMHNRFAEGFVEFHSSGLALDELSSMVDDHNWLDRDYLHTSVRVMNELPSVAACGGRSTAITEVDPPDWFARRCEFFAVGDQAEVRGSIDRRWLWGAGLTLRKSAVDALYAEGWRPTLSDRTGRSGRSQHQRGLLGPVTSAVTSPYFRSWTLGRIAPAEAGQHFPGRGEIVAGEREASPFGLMT